MHHAENRDRLTALVSAIIAVLAALGTMVAHHRSISALALKNQAILTTAQASDLYTTYETRRVRVAIYSTLLDAHVIADPKARSTSTAALDHERASSLAVFHDAKALEARAAVEQEQSERLLLSFETLEIATTLFEIAIVFASIAALTEQRLLLWFGVGMTVIGAALAFYGYLQPH